MCLPSYTLALAWLDFFKNERVGGAAGIYQFLFGVPTPDWLAYGFVPIVITLSLHYYPFTYLLLSGALVSVDAHLEESGEVLGANRWTILRRITFPIVLPALVSSFILTFSRALGTFGTPYFLGAPVRYFTLATTIYSNIVNRTPAMAYISALVLILISVLIIYGNQRVTGSRSFVTIAGKGFHHRLTPLGTWKYPAFFVAASVILLAVFVPLFLLIWQTLMLYPNDYSLGNLTLHYWIGKSTPAFAEGEPGILRNAQILGAAWNSVKLSVAGGPAGRNDRNLYRLCGCEKQKDVALPASRTTVLSSVSDSEHRLRRDLSLPLHPGDRTSFPPCTAPFFCSCWSVSQRISRSPHGQESHPIISFH